MKLMDLPPGIPDVHDYGANQRLALVLASGETLTQIKLSDFAWAIQRIVDLEKDCEKLLKRLGEERS